VFDPLTSDQDVEGNVQNVIGFMIGTMAFQHVEVLVDIADQIDPPCQQQHRTNSTGGKVLNAIAEFVVDIISLDSEGSESD
jgi:hypothetical protein